MTRSLALNCPVHFSLYLISSMTIIYISLLYRYHSPSIVIPIFFVLFCFVCYHQPTIVITLLSLLVSFPLSLLFICIFTLRYPFAVHDFLLKFLPLSFTFLFFLLLSFPFSLIIILLSTLSNIFFLSFTSLYSLHSPHNSPILSFL